MQQQLEFLLKTCYRTQGQKILTQLTAGSLSRTLENRQSGEVGIETVPDKVYFKIGEVCGLTGIKQHVLRYWEAEFKILKPVRGVSKQRLYRREDVQNIFRIKNLLQDKGFTLAGAKKALASQKKQPVAVNTKNTVVATVSQNEFYAKLKKELQILHKMLED